MQRNGRVMGKVWRSVALLALAACGGSNSAPPSEATATGAEGSGGPPSTSPARSQRLICPQCTQNAGGETSDFGDNSALSLGGSGLSAGPTPCQQSEQRSRIDDATARALGFGAVLDRLATAFDQPLEWTPQRLEAGKPATGYAVQSRVRGSTRVTAIEQVTPALAGCVESLHVGVAVTLETADGALSIAGQIDAEIQRDSERLELDGWLDLSTARGTLEISPPPTDAAIAGYVILRLYVWPEEVRVGLHVSVLELPPIGRDTLNFLYDPLDGRAPVDACPVSARPIAFAESLAATQDNSLAAAYPEIQALVNDTQPYAARWTSGQWTSVSVELGQPFGVCDLYDGRVGYKLPFGLQSSDGRVQLQRDANGYLAFENGAWREGWVEIFPLDEAGTQAGVIEDPATFALTTGISGVDFGELGGGLWHTQLTFSHTVPPVRGELAVDGVDTDGHVAGTKSAILQEPLARLLW
ncbi:MAG: hypothetical protein ABI895_39745 [Deltaproteobacteria bacterium]